MDLTFSPGKETSPFWQRHDDCYPSWMESGFCGYRVTDDLLLRAWCMMKRKSEMIQFSSLKTCSSPPTTISAVISIPFKISNSWEENFTTLELFSCLFIHFPSTFESNAGWLAGLSNCLINILVPYKISASSLPPINQTGKCTKYSTNSWGKVKEWHTLELLCQDSLLLIK